MGYNWEVKGKRSNFQGFPSGDTQSHHFCKKHKKLKEYDKFYSNWECNSCWTESNEKTVIYQDKPFRTIVKEKEILGKNIP